VQTLMAARTFNDKQHLTQDKFNYRSKHIP